VDKNQLGLEGFFINLSGNKGLTVKSYPACYLAMGAVFLIYIGAVLFSLLGGIWNRNMKIAAVSDVFY